MEVLQVDQVVPGQICLIIQMTSWIEVTMNSQGMLATKMERDEPIRILLVAIRFILTRQSPVLPGMAGGITTIETIQILGMIEIYILTRMANLAGKEVAHLTFIHNENAFSIWIP